MELENLWQDYGLDDFQAGIDALFPQYHISLSELLRRLMTGDVIGVLSDLLREGVAGATGSIGGVKNIFVWLLVLGVFSALMSHFMEIFDRHQVADLGFYFMYLLMTAVLLKCFMQVSQTAVESMENILLFIKLLVPTYLLSVGIATGTVTAGACYQLMILLIYAVESVLLGLIVPLIYSYCLLAVVNGIWIEERLTLFMELLKKGIDWTLKAALGAVTGISFFQSVLTPVLDSVKSGVLQKAASAIPGIGNTADGLVGLVAGSAVVIKNSIGAALLLLLVLLCIAPLCKILMTALLVKCAAAFMGIISDKRITACADHTGDAGLMLFRTTGTAMLLFLILIALVAITTNRGF